MVAMHILQECRILLITLVGARGSKFLLWLCYVVDGACLQFLGQMIESVEAQCLIVLSQVGQPSQS